MSINVCNDRSMASITSLPSGVSGSSLVLLSTQTASSSATIDFTSDIDSTYKEYIFKFIDVHPATDAVNFQFQADTGTNTNYNQTITSTSFSAQHNEADSVAQQAYHAGFDQAQGTGFQQINANEVGADADQCISGTLHLFNPSNTTFVKHFILRSVVAVSSNQQEDVYVAGYFNTTTALTRVRFKFNSGNIDSGTIKMYGVV
jgi:hypothetical protein